jgi:hypothetical protein
VSTATHETAPARHGWVKYLLAVIVLAIAAMWIYAFVFAPREGVNPVKDDAWADGAEAACEAASERLEPLVFRTRISEGNKAEQLPGFVANLDQATAVLDDMLDEIEALPRSSERAQQLVPLWLADYRTFVADVREWTDSLRAGNIAEFGVTITDTGIPVDERINTFATENRIKACRTDYLTL